MSSLLSGSRLVLLDNHEGHLRPPVLELVTAARSLGVPVEGFGFGDGVDVVPALSERLRPVTLAERSERPTSGRPELGEAEVVIAGGRGTGGDFSVIEQLADLLGAGVGATRVATGDLFTALPQTIAELHRLKEPEGSK